MTQSNKYVNFLRSLDWPRLQLRYAIAYSPQEIEYMMRMRNYRCQDVYQLASTRCLFSTNTSAFLLNNADTWREIDLFRTDLSSLRAINIEIDVTDRLDHMFILVYLGSSQESPTGWYIIQSYINQYTTRIEPIDINAFLSMIKRWTVSGVNPQEWKQVFHADMPSRNRAILTVYGVSRIFPDSMHQSVKEIEGQISSVYKDDITICLLSL